MINHMNPGDEAKHFQWLLQHALYRGTDVRLSTSDLYDPIPIKVPQLAFRWHWKTQLAFRRKSSQHFDSLELQALPIAIRWMVATSTSGVRYFHLVDSMFTANVIAKGRSSSKPLNPLARKLIAIVIAGGTYPIIFWTISNWNCQQVEFQ